MKLATLTLAAILTSSALAQPANQDYHLKLSVGAEYTSRTIKRGAILYDSFQVFPIFALHLANDDFFLVGSSMHYRRFLTESLRVRLIANFDATADEPLYETGQEVDKTMLRPYTNEFDVHLEWVLAGLGELSVLYSKDLRAHHGAYSEAKVRAVLAQIPFRNLSFEPAVFGAIGGGDQLYNEHLYGVGAASGGATNFRVGLSLSAPPQIDYFFPAIEVSYFEVMGADNRGASRMRSFHGWQVLALFAKSVWSW